jgi:putative ATPase
LVNETGNLPIPLHLRNAPTKLMKELNYGKGYQYSHNNPGKLDAQEFMPEEIVGTTLFEPGNNSREKDMRKNLQAVWKEKYGY